MASVTARTPRSARDGVLWDFSPGRSLTRLITKGVPLKESPERPILARRDDLCQQMNAHSETAATDDRFVVLASRRRQLAIYHIHECGGEVGLTELSRRIAATEADIPIEAVEEAAVTQVSDTLYITHLPLLIDHGVVEYDYDDGVIRATTRLEALVELVDEPRGERRRWSFYYAIPAVVLTVAVLAIDSGFVAGSTAALAGVALVGVVALLLVPLLKYTDARPLSDW